MYDGNFASDIPYTSPYREDERFLNHTVFNFYDVYIPANLDLESDARDNNAWHKLDYTVTSDTSELTPKTAEELMYQFYLSTMDNVPRFPNRYTNTIYANIEFTHAGFTSWNREVDVDLGQDSYGNGGSTATGYNFPWLYKNLDFYIGKVGLYSSPKTVNEAIEASKFPARYSTQCGGIWPALLFNKLPINRNYSKTIIKNTSAENRRVYIPLLFIRKRTEIPTVVDNGSTVETRYEQLNGLLMLATPYNVLELDETTTTPLSETKTYLGKQFRLHRAEISAVKGMPYYAKTEGGMTSLEAIKTIFREGYYVGSGMRNNDYQTDLSTLEFIIEIKRVYRDNTKLFVEYFIQSDYNNIPKMSDQTIESYGMKRGIYQQINQNNGANYTKVRYITTGTTAISVKVLGTSLDNNLWYGYLKSGWYKPDALDQDGEKAVRSKYAANNSASELQDIASNQEDRHKTNANYPKDAFPPMVSKLGVLAETCIDTSEEGAYFIVLISYEWIPVSYRAILMGEQNPFMKDLTRIHLEDNDGILDSPGISVQFLLRQGNAVKI